MPSNKKIAEGLAFTQDDCRRVISEAWARYTGQPPSGAAVATNLRAPGFFGLTQLRRAHLFKLPTADPVLPAELGEYPRFQSDKLREKHWEFVSRMLENRFTIKATASPDTQKARELADRAEWVLTYICESIQERTGVDWQKALAEGVSAYGKGILHWRIAPELSPKTPDAGYLDDLPADPDERKRYGPTEEAIGGDRAKGKYRESAASVTERSRIAKARGAAPIHVEVVAPDQAATIADESLRPGDGITVHIKEVGIVDYNGKLSKDGLQLKAAEHGGKITLSLEDTDEDIAVGMERPAPMGTQMPSVAGWKQRIAIAYVWTREECYELVSTSLLTGASEAVINESAWLLIKASKHGYGRNPFVSAFATVEENEWDPALRYLPALHGLYQMKPAYDYTRALEIRIATEIAVRRYFMTQDKDAPPLLEGDEDGEQIILERDSARAQTLPPGADLKAVGPDDMSPAFIRSRELQGEELAASAPQTGQSPIEANTKPWTARLGQSQANAYPTLVLDDIRKKLAEMIRNWVEVAAKPVGEGGLGVGLYVPGRRKVDGKMQLDMATAVGMEPEDWEGIWIDVEISPVSGAERVTQVQLDMEQLNNPIHVMTPEMFVGDALGVQDASGHMQQVDAYWAIAPYMDGLVKQKLAEHYGRKVLVGADGVLVNTQGQETQPADVLMQNGARRPPGVPSMTAGQAGMPGLPALAGNGAAPVAGLA